MVNLFLLAGLAAGMVRETDDVTPGSRMSRAEVGASGDSTLTSLIESSPPKWLQQRTSTSIDAAAACRASRYVTGPAEPLGSVSYVSQQEIRETGNPFNNDDYGCPLSEGASNRVAKSCIFKQQDMVKPIPSAFVANTHDAYKGDLTSLGPGCYHDHGNMMRSKWSQHKCFGDSSNMLLQMHGHGLRKGIPGGVVGQKLVPRQIFAWYFHEHPNDDDEHIGNVHFFYAKENAYGMFDLAEDKAKNTLGKRMIKEVCSTECPNNVCNQCPDPLWAKTAREEVNQKGVKKLVGNSEDAHRLLMRNMGAGQAKWTACVLDHDKKETWPTSVCGDSAVVMMPLGALYLRAIVSKAGYTKYLLQVPYTDDDRMAEFWKDAPLTTYWQLPEENKSPCFAHHVLTCDLQSPGALQFIGYYEDLKTTANTVCASE